MRALVATLALVLGLACGLATALVHRDWWGLVLGVGTAVTVPWALPAAWWGRPVFAVGWVAAILAVLLPPAGGGFMVVGDLLGYGLIGGSLVLLVACVVTSRPGRHPERVGPSS